MEILYEWSCGAWCVWPECSNADLCGLLRMHGKPDKIVVQSKEAGKKDQVTYKPCTVLDLDPP